MHNGSCAIVVSMQLLGVKEDVYLSVSLSVHMLCACHWSLPYSCVTCTSWNIHPPCCIFYGGSQVKSFHKLRIAWKSLGWSILQIFSMLDYSGGGGACADIWVRGLSCESHIIGNMWDSCMWFNMLVCLGCFCALSEVYLLVCILSIRQTHCVVTNSHDGCARETSPHGVCVCVLVVWGATMHSVCCGRTILEDKMFLWLGLAWNYAPWICGPFIFESTSLHALFVCVHVCELCNTLEDCIFEQTLNTCVA